MNHGLQLQPGKWYVWQMFPGNGSISYMSPIRIECLTPAETGRKDLLIEFYNAFYAPGVRHFRHQLRILIHEPLYIVAQLIEDARPGTIRACTIMNMTPDWERVLIPDFAEENQHCGDEDRDRALNDYLMDD